MKNLNIRLSIFFIIVLATVQAQVYKPDHPQAPQMQEQKNSEVKFPEAAAFAKANITYKITNAAANTFCYDIFSDGKLLIHQPSVPGIAGNKGFKDKASAEKVADLVVKKIKKGEMPPTVTIEEMKKLNAAY